MNSLRLSTIAWKCSSLTKILEGSSPAAATSSIASKVASAIADWSVIYLSKTHGLPEKAIPSACKIFLLREYLVFTAKQRLTKHLVPLDWADSTVLFDL
jgi:hypothetical protein